MSQPISLKEAERRTYRTFYNDGLWDVFLGSFILIFAIAPLLSERLGDFWSSFVFLPFWGLVYLGIWLLRRTVVIPRLGTVTYGPARKARLTRFTTILLLFNGVVLVLGILAAANVGSLPGAVFPILLGSFALIAFTLAGYFLDIPRLYVYGLLVGLAPLVGEWLWVNAGASHHGFPITFGFVSAVMISVGVLLFLQLLVRTAPPDGDLEPEA